MSCRSNSDSHSPSGSEGEDGLDVGMCGFGREPRYTAKELAEGAGDNSVVNAEEGAMALAEPDFVWRVAWRIFSGASAGNAP